MERTTTARNYDTLRYLRTRNQALLRRMEDIEKIDDYSEEERHAVAYGEELPEEPALRDADSLTIGKLREYLSDLASKGEIIDFEVVADEDVKSAIRMSYTVNADRKKLGFFGAARRDSEIWEGLFSFTSELDLGFYPGEWTSETFNDELEDQRLFFQAMKEEGLAFPEEEDQWEKSVSLILDRYTVSHEN